MALAVLAALTALLALQRLAHAEGQAPSPRLVGQLRGVGRLVALGLPWRWPGSGCSRA